MLGTRNYVVVVNEKRLHGDDWIDRFLGDRANEEGNLAFSDGMAKLGIWPSKHRQRGSWPPLKQARGGSRYQTAHGADSSAYDKSTGRAAPQRGYCLRGKRGFTVDKPSVLGEHLAVHRCSDATRTTNQQLDIESLLETGDAFAKPLMADPERIGSATQASVFENSEQMLELT